MRDLGLLEDQLAVDHQREEVADDEHEIQIALCAASGAACGQELLERADLLVEAAHVRDSEVAFVVRRPSRRTALRGAAGRTLRPEEHIVGRVVAVPICG